MTRLSVNINKIATLRNARGGNVPDVIKVALDCERFGADGITVHPRPDERHIRTSDVHALREVLKTEFNIEGNPVRTYMELVKEIGPAQATLVPDAEHVITSNSGWDTIRNEHLLTDLIAELKARGIRVSVFVNPEEQYIEGAKKAGADRVELYTGPYAHVYPGNPAMAVQDYAEAARYAHQIGLGVNAGHDLSLENLRYFKEQVPFLDEVSIGHALISDALYFGLQNTVMMYKRLLTEPAQG